MPVMVDFTRVWRVLGVDKWVSFLITSGNWRGIMDAIPQTYKRESNNEYTNDWEWF